MIVLKKKQVGQEMEKILKEIQRSEKRFKLAMMVVLFIVSLAAAMIFISIISSI